MPSCAYDSKNTHSDYDCRGSFPIVVDTGKCDDLTKACDEALKTKDAQAEALKKAVKDARKEADDCYAKSKANESQGGWLVPVLIGIAGFALGVAIGR